MNMQPLDRSRYDEWDRFVYDANGTVFHTSWWYDAWGVDFNIYALVNGDGQIESGMPVYISRFQSMPKAMDFLGIRGVTKPPLTPVNGPVFRACAKTSRPTIYTHVKNEILNSLRYLPDADFYDFHLWRFCDDLMPFIWNGFETQVLYTYVIPAGNVETWQGNMSKNTRRFLKEARITAEKEGFSGILTDAPFEDMDLPFKDTMEAKGFQVSLYSKMHGWWDAVKKRKAGMSYLIRDKEGRPACASIMVWDNRSAYALMNGMVPSVRSEGKINMLLFERMIKDALDMGLDFDFEGSSLMGVERFYRGWGGEMRPCFRATKIPSTIAYFGLKAHKYLSMHRKKGWIVPE
jgi:Acetyltransferase (GNAT) domain